MTDEMIADAPDARDTASPEERQMRKLVARVLWAAENETTGDAAARKAAYTEARPAYMKKAKRILRQMEKRGVTLSLSPAAAETDDGLGED